MDMSRGDSSRARNAHLNTEKLSPGVGGRMRMQERNFNNKMRRIWLHLCFRSVWNEKYAGNRNSLWLFSADACKEVFTRESGNSFSHFGWRFEYQNRVVEKVVEAERRVEVLGDLRKFSIPIDGGRFAKSELLKSFVSFETFRHPSLRISTKFLIPLDANSKRQTFRIKLPSKDEIGFLKTNSRSIIAVI